MNTEKVFVSPEGLQRLREELQSLQTEKSREVADRIEKAKEMGDLSENADYTEAKEEYARIQGRILKLQDAISRAQVIKSVDTDSVGIGSLVTVSVSGRERQFRIVGATEADPSSGLISNESPIGLALIGKRAGETATVQAPSGAVDYRIEKISA